MGFRGAGGSVKHWHKVSVRGGGGHLERMESCHSGLVEIMNKEIYCVNKQMLR